jgi:tetratricopeptide (TPR) repeat protein
MKKNILVIMIISSFIISCSDDFFNRYPSDKIQIETYLKNDVEVENVLLDNYYYLRSISQNIIYINDIGTDIAYDRKTNNSTDHINLNESNITETFGISSAIWDSCYCMINRCNYVLNSLDNVVNENNKKQFEGEAKFFRAYSNFQLVRLFGDIPIVTSVIDDYTKLYGYQRIPIAEVYEEIIADLESAINDLPFNYSESSKIGRATKVAALTMLSEVYMTNKEFDKAKTYLKQIIDFSNANPTILGIESNIEDVFNSTLANGKEIIFAAQFNNGSSIISNYLMSACIPNIISPSGQNTYTYQDGSKCTIKTSEGTSIMLMTYDLFNKYDQINDKRFNKLVYNGIYDAEYTSVSPFKYMTSSNATYLPVTLKYYDHQNNYKGLTKYSSANDNIIYRYADVILMYAECLNETGQLNDAIENVNIIRRRAGLSDATSTTKDDNSLIIENERLLELCFEGHRWFDLLRTNRLTQVMVEHYKWVEPGLNSVIQSHMNGNDKVSSQAHWKWENTSYKILFPIPYSQMKLMSNFGWMQNDGY